MTKAATLRVLVASIAIAASQSAIAQCSGFTDVAPGHAQCPNVDWLRNRAITLGCSSVTLYCPGDPVTRLAMAAFMNRLGNALTPTIAAQQGGGASLALGSPMVVCQSQTPAAGFPRWASVIGVVNTLATAPVGVSMHVVVSDDGGATWTAATQVPQWLATQGGWSNGAVQKSAIPLDAGTPYRFAVRLEALPGTTQLGTWSCQIKTKVASRTGTGVPY